MKTVFVGLSGGVDSAVSAALLKAQGFNVVGAFIKIWQPEFTACTWREDRLDAMRVAVALDIPFREIDLSDEYKNEVVNDMIEAYQKGITPNPDILCNSRIKFGHFAKWAFAEGADCVATGHYARIFHNDIVSRYELHRGKDPAKDQSYFLHTLTQGQLAKTFFPAGEYEKKEVRALAEKYKLPVSSKPDSQGLCFVGDVSIPEFLSRYIDLEEGPVINEVGARVGTHHGAALYTIGQRHGFEVSSEQPLYVTHIDTTTNTIQVSPQKESAATKSLLLKNASWIGDAPNGVFDVQTRYRESPVQASIKSKDGESLLIFETPHIAAPGQSAVVYDNTRCLGGAVITSQLSRVAHPDSANI